MDYIKKTEACERAGITSAELAKWEREWKILYKEEMPIPRDDNKHRIFSEDWIKWLRAVKQAFDNGKNWMYVAYEIPDPTQVYGRISDPRKVQEPVYR